jgi:succinoglycan biosynthesis protein ExoM
MILNMKTILIGLCTYKRPKMLADCLAGITALSLPIGVQVHLVVVDNDITPGLVTETEKNMDGLLAPIHEAGIFAIYIQEQLRGISYARNAVLNYSHKIKADYIAFIDDDEIPDQNWLVELYQMIDIHQCAGVQGIIYRRYPNGDLTITGRRRGELPNGHHLSPDDAVTTGNIIFSTKLIRDWGLKFHSQLGLSGGEDVDFFEQAQRKGGIFLLNKKAIVIETVPLERTTFGWRLLQEVNFASYKVIKSKLEYGHFQTILKQTWRVIKMSNLFFYYLISTLWMGKKGFMKSLKLLARISGILMALIGFPANRYAKTTGF